MCCGFRDETFSLEKTEFDQDAQFLEDILTELEADQSRVWRLLYLHNKARGSRLQ